MSDGFPRCPRCGTTLAANGELCPACLLQAGLETTDTHAGETRLTAAPTSLASSDETYITPTGTPEASRKRAPAATARPDQIGPYAIVRPLGEGGMGAVYLAEQQEPIRRTVALKLIKLGMDTAEVVARFEAERQALALMDHPNIAAVLDAGATPDGRPYFVMEYAPGAPITDYCDRHALGTRARLELFMTVCAAVQHAHQKGIIHRDLKPSNVLVTEVDNHPVPKVIDFGIAKATDQRLTERTMFTQQGLLIGTPEYMSPEQAELGAVDIDTRADIYSLGIILYELLTGVVPFTPTRLREGGFSELQRIIREEEPVRPSTKLGATPPPAGVTAGGPGTRATLVHELRGDLDWITLKALEKDRARRYASAAELAADVGRHLKDEPVVARPPTVSYRVQKFVRRNQLGVTAAAVVALAVVGGLIASLILYRQADRARRDADLRRTEAVSAKNEAAANAESERRQRTLADEASREAGRQREVAQQEAEAARAATARADEQRLLAEQQACGANILAADISLRAGDGFEAHRRLESCPLSMRTWDWQYLDRTIDASEYQLDAAGWIQSLSFTPDSSRIQAITLDGLGYGGRAHLASSHLEAGNSTLVVSPAEIALAASRDGRFIVTSDWRVQTVLADPQHSEILIAQGPASSPSPPPNHLRLRDVVAGRDIAVLDLPQAGTWRGHTAGLVKFLKGGGLEIPIPEISPSGATTRGTPMTRALESVGSGGASVVTLGGLFPYIADAVFSPDGHRVAAWSWSNDISVWDVDAGHKLGTLTGHTDTLTGVVFSGDGKRVVAGSYDRRVLVWEVNQESPVATLDNGGAPVIAVAITPDGKQVAAGGADGTVRCWTVPDGHLIWSRTTTPSHALVFSPDGRFLVSGSEDGIVRLWEAASGLGLAQFRGHSKSIIAADFSPDGTSVAAATTKAARVWKIASSSSSVAGRHDNELSDDGLQWLPQGVLASTSLDRTVRTWAGLGRADRTIRLGTPGEMLLEVSSAGATTYGSGMLAVSPDGRLLAATDADTVHLIDSISGRDREILAGLRGGVTGLAFSADSQRVFCATSDKMLRVADVSTGLASVTLTVSRMLRHLVATRDGRWLVALTVDSGSIQHTTEIRDAQTLELAHEIRRSTSVVSIDPTGRQIALSSGNSIVLYDLNTARQLRSTNIAGQGTAIAYHPEQPLLAVALSDGTIRILDANTLETRFTLIDQTPVHDANEPYSRMAPADLARNPFAERVNSQLPDKHRPYPISLAFSPDGSRLATGWSVDGSIRVFDATPRTVAQQARSSVSYFLESVLGQSGLSAAFSAPLVDWLQTNPLLTAEVRGAAIQIALNREDDPAVLNTASWNVVKKPGAEASEYRSALARAEKAVRLRSTPGYLNTVALALYRNGRYQEALSTVEQVTSLRGPNSNDLVISILCRLQLGRVDSARADLDRLTRETKATTGDLPGLISEATALSENLKRGRR
jgi:WD40 repeat protein/serine/threonine protein kinase